MTAKVRIKSEYLNRLKVLLCRYVPDAEVWAYGSRVSGGGHEASDLDIVLRSPDNLGCPQENMTELKKALSESDIPILIDVLDWARLTENFRSEILKCYIVIKYRIAADEKLPIDAHGQ